MCCPTVLHHLEERKQMLHANFRSCDKGVATSVAKCRVLPCLRTPKVVINLIGRGGQGGAPFYLRGISFISTHLKKVFTMADY
eukprot:scaffold18483_cov77-Skeletonema_marinoi.AAC.1